MAAPPEPVAASPDPDDTPHLAVGEDGALVGLPAGTPRASIESVETDPYAAKLTPEARDLADDSDLLDTLRSGIADDPEAAAAVVRAWLREDALSA
jgi:flagellar biosynthesis/type III secretory pathway M-ring protein FliF/YscJ